MALKVDANNIVTEGRFIGRSLDEVERYLEGLEQAVVEPGQQPKVDGGAPPVKQKTEAELAAEKLTAQGHNRVDPVQMQLLANAELQDEESFAATVKDYAKYKDKIWSIKNGDAAKGIPGLQPIQRAQRGLHRTLYINVKSQDATVAKRIFDEVEEPETDEQKAERLAKEKADADAKAAAEAAARRQSPKPAPPMAAPTPGSRQAPPPRAGERKPKLVANRKIEIFCKSNNTSVEDYLLRLEDMGKTQEDIDTMGQMGRSQDAGRRDPYARTFAKRS